MSQRDSGIRLCVFAHFDQDNIVDEYVLFYLQELKKVADRIVFVTAASLSAESISRLRHICDSVILRENRGYDFAGWQASLKSETFENIDELLLCNDSVYGPLFPLEKVFDQMRKRKCDFWGITSSHQIAFHIQSYFLVFRKPVLASEVFQNFWQSMEMPQAKDQIIKLCEIGLSQTLLNAGFKAFSYTRYRFLVTRTLLYRIRSYLIRAGKRIIGYMRSFLFSFSRRKKEKNIRTTITRVIRYAISIVSRAMTMILNGFYELIGVIRYPKERLSGLFLHFMNTLRSINVTHLFWKQLILYSGMPFIKVDLLRDNPTAMNINDYEKVISVVSNYDIPMIRSHLTRVRNSSRNKGKRF